MKLAMFFLVTVLSLPMAQALPESVVRVAEQTITNQCATGSKAVRLVEHKVRTEKVDQGLVDTYYTLGFEVQNSSNDQDEDYIEIVVLDTAPVSNPSVEQGPSAVSLNVLGWTKCRAL